MRLRSFVAVSFLGLCAFSTFTWGDDTKLGVKCELIYGPGGGVRTREFVSGETVNISVALAGLSRSPEGESRYGLRLDLIGKEIGTLATVAVPEIKTLLRQGGGFARHYAHIVLPAKCVPGEYSIALKVEDFLNRSTAHEVLPISVLDASLLNPLNIRLTHDLAGAQPAGCCYYAGANGFLLFGIAGLTGREGKFNAEITVTTLDHNGAPVDAKPIVVKSEGEIVPGGTSAGYAGITLNRAGKFALQLEVYDVIANKTVKRLIPFVVIDPLALPTP